MRNDEQQCACCAAVREDRTPGGKHRAKKLRVDDSDVSTTTGSGGVVIDWKGCEQEEQLLSRLLDTRPDAVNAVDGACVSLFFHYSCFV